MRRASRGGLSGRVGCYQPMTSDLDASFQSLQAAVGHVEQVVGSTCPATRDPISCPQRSQFPAPIGPRTKSCLKIPGPARRPNFVVTPPPKCQEPSSLSTLLPPRKIRMSAKSTPRKGPWQAAMAYSCQKIPPAILRSQTVPYCTHTTLSYDAECRPNPETTEINYCTPNSNLRYPHPHTSSKLQPYPTFEGPRPCPPEPYPSVSVSYPVKNTPNPYCSDVPPPCRARPCPAGRSRCKETFRKFLDSVFRRTSYKCSHSAFGNETCHECPYLQRMSCGKLKTKCPASHVARNESLQCGTSYNTDAHVTCTKSMVPNSKPYACLISSLIRPVSDTEAEDYSQPSARYQTCPSQKTRGDCPLSKTSSNQSVSICASIPAISSASARPKAECRATSPCPILSREFCPIARRTSSCQPNCHPYIRTVSSLIDAKYSGDRTARCPLADPSCQDLNSKRKYTNIMSSLFRSFSNQQVYSTSDVDMNTDFCNPQKNTCTRQSLPGAMSTSVRSCLSPRTAISPRSSPSPHASATGSNRSPCSYRPPVLEFTAPQSPRSRPATRESSTDPICYPDASRPTRSICICSSPSPSASESYIDPSSNSEIPLPPVCTTLIIRCSRGTSPTLKVDKWCQSTNSCGTEICSSDQTLFPNVSYTTIISSILNGPRTTTQSVRSILTNRDPPETAQCLPVSEQRSIFRSTTNLPVSPIASSTGSDHSLQRIAPVSEETSNTSVSSSCPFGDTTIDSSIAKKSYSKECQVNINPEISSKSSKEDLKDSEDKNDFEELENNFSDVGSQPQSSEQSKKVDESRAKKRGRRWFSRNRKRQDTQEIPCPTKQLSSICTPSVTFCQETIPKCIESETNRQKTACPPARTNSGCVPIPKCIESESNRQKTVCPLARSTSGCRPTPKCIESESNRQKTACPPGRSTSGYETTTKCVEFESDREKTVCPSARSTCGYGPTPKFLESELNRTKTACPPSRSIPGCVSGNNSDDYRPKVVTRSLRRLRSASCPVPGGRPWYTFLRSVSCPITPLCQNVRESPQVKCVSWHDTACCTGDACQMKACSLERNDAKDKIPINCVKSKASCNSYSCPSRPEDEANPEVTSNSSKDRRDQRPSQRKTILKRRRSSRSSSGSSLTPRSSRSSRKPRPSRSPESSRTPRTSRSSQSSRRSRPSRSSQSSRTPRSSRSSQSSRTRRSSRSSQSSRTRRSSRSSRSPGSYPSSQSFQRQTSRENSFAADVNSGSERRCPEVGGCNRCCAAGQRTGRARVRSRRRGRKELGYELLQAAETGNADAVGKLLKRGADPNFQGDGSDWTALHRAARKGHSTTILQLVAAGADLEARTPYNFTALHIAAYKDRFGLCVAFLVDAGADVEARSKSGRTPLHYAVAAGHIRCVRTLLQAGASTTARDVFCKRPLDLVPCAARKAVTEVMDEYKPCC